MKWLYLILGIVSLAASFFFYRYGSTNSNLSELTRYFYLPLPIGGYFFYGFIRRIMNKQK